MFSIIINSIDPVKFAAVRSMYERVMGATDFEIIGVHDSKSAAEGYNRAVAASRGDLLVFSHDDVEFLIPDLGFRLQSHLRSFDIVGIAGTTRMTHPMWCYAGPPHMYGQVAHQNQHGNVFVEIFSAPAPVVGGIQAVDSMFFTARRQAVTDIGFDAVRYTNFHLFEADFCIRATARGLKIGVACDLPMIHYSRGTMAREWADSGRVFLDQHGAKFPPYREVEFSPCMVIVSDRQAIVDAMSPPHFRR